MSPGKRVSEVDGKVRRCHICSVGKFVLSYYQEEGGRAGDSGNYSRERLVEQVIYARKWKREKEGVHSTSLVLSIKIIRTPPMESVRNQPREHHYRSSIGLSEEPIPKQFQ